MNTPTLQSSEVKHNLLAGAIVGVLVIPQSLGYATLAGLPPVVGLYTAILPAIVYAIFGTSRLLAVGPVAITAIMTAAALSGHSVGSDEYLLLASLLAVMTGLILCLASLARLSWIVQFVSQGVAAGFVSGSAILILISQLKHLLGIPMTGHTLMSMFDYLYHNAISIHPLTAMIGLGAFIVLIINRYGQSWLYAHLTRTIKKTISQSLPLLLMMLSIVASRHFGWQNLGVSTLEPLPNGWLQPNTALFKASLADVFGLGIDATLMALIVFVSSIAVAKNLATVQHPISPAKELNALGLSNLASGLFGGFSVAGGISRTSLNISVGASDKIAGAAAGLTVLVILLFFHDVLTGLPYAILGAIIASSALAMIDVTFFKQALKSDKADAIAFIITLVATCFFGLNTGLIAGLLVSFIGVIYASHRVHIAVLGQVGSSEHFRNIERHTATTFDDLLIIRIDESLYFGNSDGVYDALIKLCNHSTARHVILTMTAVNRVDLTAQNMLINLNQKLSEQQKYLHLAEIKGPVMDILKHTDVINKLSGHVFLSTKMAVDELKSA